MLYCTEKYIQRWELNGHIRMGNNPTKYFLKILVL